MRPNVHSEGLQDSKSKSKIRSGVSTYVANELFCERSRRILKATGRRLGNRSLQVVDASQVKQFCQLSQSPYFASHPGQMAFSVRDQRRALFPMSDVTALH